MESEHSDDCVFCAILKEGDDEKNWILYRGKHCFVVINLYPYSNGHVMVVCNRHVDFFSNLSIEERAEVMEVVSRCERVILDAYKPGGVNVGVNLGRSAGAGILRHLHVHLVPRWHGDTNFMTAIGETRVVSEDLSNTYKRLKPHFEG